MAEIVMPQLGETVTEGTITKWFKKVGDTVTADEALFEVSTDKVDTEVPSPVAGTLTEIRANEGDVVAVGQIIAVVGDGVAAPAPAPAATAPVGAAPAPAATAAAPVAAPEPPPAVAMAAPVTAAPALPASTAPDPVAAVDASSIADNRLLSPVVRRLVAENGIDPVQLVGTGPGGRITRENVLDFLDQRTASGGSPAPMPAPAATPAAVPAPPLITTPLAAQPTAAMAVAPAPVAPAPAAPAPVAPAPVAAGGPAASGAVKLSKIRSLTGDHMVMSLSVAPHAFSVVEVDFSNVDAARGAVKAAWKAAEGFSLTYLPFICRAVIDALAVFPHMNASVGNGELLVHDFVDLGIAVDLDYQGLLVPVVRSAETKRMRAIAREINDLAGRARTRKLSPGEIQGGTFTISNNGSAGSVLTMPIINQPQVAILSTDAIVRKPVVVNTPGGGEAIAIHPVGNLAMSWDHRAFDGAYAAGFLVKIKEFLERRDWTAEL